MSDGNLPFAPKFDHLVYMRVFEGCNLHCEHCFIPSNPKKMDMGQMGLVGDIVSTFATEGNEILLQWHGGEPTMFGAEWLEEAIKTVEGEGGQFKWRHGIQTNLLTYNSDWTALYHKYFEGEVGVSWDPVIRLMRQGRPETNADYEAKFWPQLAALQADGLKPYMVMTGTKLFFEHFKNPFALFDFLVEKGIERAHIERITETGFARENWARLGLSHKEYSHYMSRFLRAYVRWQAQFDDVAAPLQLSPFDGLLASVKSLRAGEAAGYGCWSGSCDTRFHTIDANGYKRGCTAVTSEYDNKRAGDEKLEIPDFVATRKVRQFNCAKCEYRPICSSGCMALSIEDGSGECAGGYGLFKTAEGLLEEVLEKVG